MQDETQDMEGSETPTPPEGEEVPPEGEALPPEEVTSGDPHERIDGLRRWINELDGKLKARTWIALLGTLAALILGGVALAVALSQDDDGDGAASQAQVGRLQAQVSQLQSQIQADPTPDTEVERNVNAVARAVDRLITQINNYQGDRQSFERDLSQIRQELRQLEQQDGGGGGQP